MLLNFFLILALSYSLTLKNELGSLYLTSGESHRLSLSDYFSGNNLSFSITKSNTTQNLSKINYSHELELLTFTPYQDPAWNKTWSFSSQQHIFIPEEFDTNVLISYNENYLFVYEIDDKIHALNLLWAGVIETPYKNSRIMGVRYGNRNNPAVIIWVVGEESNHNAFALRNDIYILSKADYTLSKTPVWANFSEIAYATEIVLGDGSIHDNLGIFCKFKESSSILYIYNIRNIHEPVLYQKISQYDTILTSKNEIEILSIFMYEYTFCILEKNFGFVSYKYEWVLSSFIETEAYELSFFGTLYSIQALHGNTLSLIAQSGVIIFQITSYGIFKFIGRINPDKSYSMQSLYVESSRNYYFLQSSNGILSIIPKEKNNFDVLCSFDLETIIGQNYQNNGIFEVYMNVINEINYYARFDKDGIRVYQINIKEWSLEVLGNDNHFIEITAEDQNGDKISSMLNVISIPSYSQEILPLDHYRKMKKDTETIFIGDQADFDFSANSFFSGPNLSFKMETFHSNIFSCEYSAPSHPTLSNNLTVPDDATKVFIYGRDLITFYPDKVTAKISNNFNTLVYNIPNPILFRIVFDKFHAIYSEPSEGSYMISLSRYEYYTYESNLQSIKSNIECKFFDLARFYLLCANSIQLEIYDNFGGPWSLRFSLTGETFYEGFSWNLLDAKFSQGLFYNHLYLIDEKKGILIVNIPKLGSLNSYENSITENDGILKIVPSEHSVSFFNENGWIDIYDYPFTYLRRVSLGMPSGLISNIFADSNMIYIQLDNSTYVYDIDQPSHNSLYYIFKSSLPNIISYGGYQLSNSCLSRFFSTENGKYLEIYSIPCPTEIYWNNEKCKKDFEVSCIVAKKEKLSKNVYPINIAITAYNENYSLTQNFTVNFITSGSSIKFEAYKWKIKDNIPYNERYEMNLDEIFLGQNMTMELNINDIQITNEIGIKTPVILQNINEQVGFYQSEARLYGHILIPNNLIIITSESGFLIVNSTVLSDEPLFINITETTNLMNLSCKVIEMFPYSKNNQTLFVTSCTYNVHQTSFNINKPDNLVTSQKSLILWEFDYLNLIVTQFKMINITIIPDFLRLAPLDENHFEIMALAVLRTGDNKVSNNEIFRYRGSWQNSHIEIHQVEIINFFTLNLPHFYTEILDFLVKDPETVYWYATDQNYGIRIIETNHYNSSLISSGLPLKISSYYISLGICGDFLLISYSDIGVESYKIKNYINFELNFIYYFFSASGYSRPIPRLIVCSEDFRYIAVPIYEIPGKTAVEIWDTSTKYAANSIISVYVSKCQDYSKSKNVKFSDKNTLLMLGCEESLYRRYKINENKLIFPEISEDEYFNMIEEWGTKDFRLFITAKNYYDEEISSIIYIRREAPETHKNSWWIWVTLSVIIGCVFVGGIFGVIKVLKAKKSKPMKSFLMQELHCDEEIVS